MVCVYVCEFATLKWHDTQNLWRLAAALQRFNSKGFVRSLGNSPEMQCKLCTCVALRNVRANLMFCKLCELLNARRLWFIASVLMQCAFVVNGLICCTSVRFAMRQTRMCCLCEGQSGISKCWNSFVGFKVRHNFNIEMFWDLSRYQDLIIYTIKLIV